MRLAAFLLLVCFLLSFDAGTPPKRPYPLNYFQWPVDHTVNLAGTFGELRPNHFHAGIDIKSGSGQTGESVLSAADGYISRIRIQSNGYGKSIFVQHPNGYTTVYGHLLRYNDSIQSYVEKFQYENQTYELDICPPVNMFPVMAGQEIGKLGNTGNSNGPHVHFEIRDTKTDKAINPFLFGFNVTDNVPPTFQKMRVYALNNKNETLEAKTIALHRERGNYFSVPGDTLEIGAWRAGFAIQAYDQADNNTNENGIYSLQMLVNDSLSYAFSMESFAFEESRYINAHIDYPQQVMYRNFFNRCFILPGNQLSIYDNLSQAGMVELFKDKPSKITIIIKDYAGNSNQLDFWARRAEIDTPERPLLYNYILPYDQESVIKNDGFFLYFPKGALYENLYLNYQVSEEQSNGIFSDVHHVDNYTTPVHRYFDIGITPKNLPDNLRDKAFLALCTGNHIRNCGGKWLEDKNMLTTKCQQLGDYCIMIDTIKPMIRPVLFAANMRKAKKMAFKIRDNYPTLGKVKDISYRATVDGAWILMEFDSKNNLISYAFDNRVGPGQHTLKLEVTDNRGNTAVYEKAFTR